MAKKEKGHENPTFSVPFSDEKMVALELYMGTKGLSVEEEVSRFLLRLYEKHVKPEVKAFLAAKENAGKNSENLAEKEGAPWLEPPQAE